MKTGQCFLECRAKLSQSTIGFREIVTCCDQRSFVAQEPVLIAAITGEHAAFKEMVFADSAGELKECEAVGLFNKTPCLRGYARDYASYATRMYDQISKVICMLTAMAAEHGGESGLAREQLVEMRMKLKAIIDDRCASVIEVKKPRQDRCPVQNTSSLELVSCDY